jgi:hypothetical protein
MPKPSALEFRTALISRLSDAAGAAAGADPVEDNEELQRLQELLSDIGDYIWDVTRAEEAAKEREARLIEDRKFARQTHIEDLQMMLDARVSRFVTLLRVRAPGPILHGDAVLILQACERIFDHAPEGLAGKCPECGAPADSIDELHLDRSPGWRYLGTFR